MKKSTSTRRALVVALGMSVAAGFAPASIAGPFPSILPVTGPAQTMDNMLIRVAGYSLSPGDFKGYDSSGKRQRVRIRSAGNGYTLQTLTGRNSGQVFYVHQGGDLYRAADGTTMQVTSRRSFVWNGWLGTIAMND